MDQSAQREIDPHRVEERQRPRPALFKLPGAVDHLVTHAGEDGGREMSRQFGDRQIAMDELVTHFRDEGIRDFLIA